MSKKKHAIGVGIWCFMNTYNKERGKEVVDIAKYFRVKVPKNMVITLTATYIIQKSIIVYIIIKHYVPINFFANKVDEDHKLEVFLCLKINLLETYF